MEEPWKLLPVASKTPGIPLSGKADIEGLSLKLLENGDIVSTDGAEDSSTDKLIQDQLLKNLIRVLKAKIKKGNIKAHFILGQLYFEQEFYKDAFTYFELVQEHDLQSLYQLGVMYYDGLGTESNPTKGFECLLKVANANSAAYKSLIHGAQYCIGLAYFQGFGVQQSDKEAVRWWRLASNGGQPGGSAKAQSMLGMYYSLPDSKDFKQAFIWHMQAYKNGNLESQGALGVMYKFGIGVQKDIKAAFIYLKKAAARGNVYAMGVLVRHYYNCKLFTSAINLATRVIGISDYKKAAEDTECILQYILKGVSLSAFYMARCLENGTGIKKNIESAQKYYAMSYETDQQIYSELIYQKHFNLS